MKIGICQMIKGGIAARGYYYSPNAMPQHFMCSLGSRNSCDSMPYSYLIAATVISILGFIITLGGLYTAHQNKRLRNVFVYLTHTSLVLAILLLIICANTEFATYMYTNKTLLRAPVLCVTTCILMLI
jgi:hypothetical protein